MRAGHQLAQQALQVARQIQAPIHLVRAAIDLGVALALLGNVAVARLALEEGLAIYAQHQRNTQPLFDAEDDPGVTGHFFLAVCLLWLGYPEQAIAHIGQGRALAQHSGNPFTIAFIHHNFTYIHAFCRQWQVVQQEAAALLDFGRPHHFPIYVPVGLVLTGRALAETGQIAEGVAHMKEGMAAAQPTLINQTWFLTLMAEVYAHQGQNEAGLALIDEALHIVDQSGMALAQAEIVRVKGELLAGMGHKQAEAEATLQQALRLARQQKAKLFELRTAVSLARWWRQAGRYHSVPPPDRPAAPARTRL